MKGQAKLLDARETNRKARADAWVRWKNIPRSRSIGLISTELCKGLLKKGPSICLSYE
jgi:hypothetical protein